MEGLKLRVLGAERVVFLSDEGRGGKAGRSAEATPHRCGVVVPAPFPHWPRVSVNGFVFFCNRWFLPKKRTKQQVISCSVL